MKLLSSSRAKLSTSGGCSLRFVVLLAHSCDCDAEKASLQVADVPVILGQSTGQGTCTAPDSNTLCLLPTFTQLLQHPHQHHAQTALFNTAAKTPPPASYTDSPL